MLLTPKQIDFARHADRRWNLKGGATRSGKTYMDYRWIIPMRIRERIGREGLTVILGVTKSTIERNVLEPMRGIYGADLVGGISSDNTVQLFGERCYALGAEKISQLSKLRGASFKYCYGDEVADWSQDVFDLLKSRLDKPYSRFDGTFNPAGPHHWLKKFLDSDADIFSQTYSIDDNPFLDPGFVANLKREYSGTVLYDRYILGRWAAAEGAIYRPFTDRPERYIVDDLPEGEQVRTATIGVDFGGGTSAHAFCCTGITTRNRVIVLDEYREQAALTPDRLAQAFVDFVRRCRARWMIADVWCDSAEQTLINGLRAAAVQAQLPVSIGNALKRPINDRIRATVMLMGTDRFLVSRGCAATIDALQTAVWDAKHVTEDVRLDDGTTNIDSLDALEYSFEHEIPYLLESWRR
ncbi:MAG: phage terminase large subunit [Oscillospiraceae bacterium]|nr:phage terminase large subunit [Oscillospiraceae bacterium]